MGRGSKMPPKFGHDLWTFQIEMKEITANSKTQKGSLLTLDSSELNQFLDCFQTSVQNGFFESNGHKYVRVQTLI